jgi:hypothetical protein
MRWRNAWLTACSVLVLAGCGGGSDNTFTTTQQRTTPTGPPIESTVARELAGRSDAIAAKLDSGDQCGAAQEAAQLRTDLTSAINAGAVPGLYQEDLSASVNELQAQIQCTATTGEDDHGGKGKGKGKNRKHKKDRHDDRDED